MNIYECTLEDKVIVGYAQGYPETEPNNQHAFISAPTRGQARAIFADDCFAEFTAPMKIHKIGVSDDVAAGILDAEHPALDDYWQTYLVES